MTDPLRPFTVGDWLVDPIGKHISRAGEVVKIDPRNMRVLQILATRAGEIVSQAQIENGAWNNLVVTPNSVYQSIAQLRRALGHGKSGQRYIETVSRKGYRLVAAVQPMPGPPDEPQAPSLACEPIAEPIAAATPLQAAGQAVPRRHVVAVSLALLLTVAIVTVVWSGKWRELLTPSGTSQVPTGTTSTDAQPSTGLLANTAPRDEPNARKNLPQVYEADANYRQAIIYLEDFLQSQSTAVGAEDPGLVATLSRLANLYPLISEPRKSEQAARRGLELLRKLGNEASIEGVELNATLAEALADIERYAEAEQYLQHAIELSNQVNDATQYATAGVIDQLALLRIAEGRYTEAETQAHRALLAYRKVSPPIAARTAYLYSTLTWALVEQGRYDDAVAAGSTAVNLPGLDDVPAPYLLAVTYHFLGEALNKADRLAEAEAALRKELELLASIPHVRMDGARAESCLGEVLLKQGQFSEARTLLTKAHLTLQTGDGWRERKARLETNLRLQLLHRATQ